MRLRRGGTEDVPTLLRMFDEAVVWLTEHGSAGQWGTDPWSTNPDRVALVERIAAEELWLADVDGTVAGALALGATPTSYTPPADEPEVYVHLLLVARGHGGRNVGGRLLDHARSRARDQGISLVRVDCWAGGDGSLVRYYQGQGFTPTLRVPVRDTEVQVFEDRVRPRPGAARPVP
ncbi:GNAT family N-acetyltransferase [Nocardiopsis sp. MG754419]|uniref:GNAT family N-acetyltransferase n=1 Tax=Nocardiopsis sp. MG754419 TaxID=2259865 RepID=UPI001BACFFF6|nr:GNAT family N-acetyltransferase [Nocardiopsis sp. MG754419]MBR8742591.1 GNAT family N-acetyltransferase [Nocardiopsis sp. MG754419]